MRTGHISLRPLPQLTAIAILLFFLTSNAKSQELPRLTVSRNFNDFIFKIHDTALPGDNVVSYLSRHASVETSLGGQFVVSIAGIPKRSESPAESWFYYVNGVLAHTGAGTYRLRPQDRVVWDYHSWSHESFIPAIIGSYPQPFLSGYGNKASTETQILYSPESINPAKALFNSLISMGASKLSLLALSDEGPQESCTLQRILIGPWSSLKDFQLVTERYEHASRTGLWVKFDDSGLVSILTIDQKRTSTLFEAGVIAATSFPQQPCLVWLITGSSKRATSWAVDTLVHKSPLIFNKIQAVVLENGEVKDAPKL